jgi:streptogramin lyase
MVIPRLSAAFPLRTIDGGRLTVRGEGFPVAGALPEVLVNGTPARVVFASPTEVRVIVSAPDGGRVPVTVGGVEGAVTIDVGVPIATGLHQVDNPVFDRAGNLYVTYSGSRGQQVPVSIFRIDANGARESFSSAITNPTSMAMAPDGRLYVSSRFEGAVYRLDEDGSAEVFTADLGIACGLAFTPDGTLYVGDRSGTIFAVTPDGQASTLATLPSSVAAFHLALGRDCLYVSAPTLSARDVVYRVGFDGSVAVHCDGFGRPQGLGLDSDGTLLVVEALAGESGLYRVPADGPPELVLSAPRLIGFAVDRTGGLVVCTGDTAYRFPAA